MAAPPLPRAADAIIRCQSHGMFTISVGSGAPQVACRSLGEAIYRAGSFATAQHAHVWWTRNGRKSALLADITSLRKIWNEYVEMPGLRLTCEQARRLWTLDADTCTSLLESLVDLDFLVRSPDGKYTRLVESAEAIPPLRMAKAETKGRPAEARALQHRG